MKDRCEEQRWGEKDGFVSELSEAGGPGEGGRGERA